MRQSRTRWMIEYCHHQNHRKKEVLSFSISTSSNISASSPYRTYSEYNQTRNVLPGEPARLCSRVTRHRTIGCSANDDSTIHLSSTSYHDVLYVVGVSRTVNVCVTVSCSYSTRVVLIVSYLFLFFRSVVDESKERNSERPFLANTVVIAAVNVVLPWST